MSQAGGPCFASGYPAPTLRAGVAPISGQFEGLTVSHRDRQRGTRLAADRPGAWFGAELRRRRVQAGLSLNEFSAVID
jgi:hypothetical protein